jgi:HAE1 family hydrophobic/amphiphilic exporter-1
MWLSELCIRRPVLTTLVTATFLVFGAFAYRLLAVAALPEVDFPTISVTAMLRAASAADKAGPVAADPTANVDDLGHQLVTSVSTLGRTNQHPVQPHRNIDGAALDVQTALTVAQRAFRLK